MWRSYLDCRGLYKVARGQDVAVILQNATRPIQSLFSPGISVFAWNLGWRSPSAREGIRFMDGGLSGRSSPPGRCMVPSRKTDSGKFKRGTLAAIPVRTV
jgi:hypothetical protein